MYRKSHFTQLALVLMISLFTVNIAFSDVVYLKNGQTYEGKILEDTADQIVIDTMIVGIRTKYPIPRSRIDRIEHRDLPDNFFNDNPDEPEPEPEEQVEEEKPAEEDKPSFFEEQPLDVVVDEPEMQQGTEYYLVVPLIGGIGNEVHTRPVKMALEYAVDKGIQHIVFDMHSPGGAVAVAEEIFNMMLEHEETLDYHVVCQDAISASIWIVLTCDNIFMRPGSVVGGAVVYSQNRSTGEAEVDKKMNSIIASQVASRAEAHGRNRLIAESMIVSSKTVAAWYEGREVHIAEDIPRHVDPRDVILRDTDQQVLTLTARQAVSIGMASHFDDEISDLGDYLNIDKWAQYNDYGEQATKLYQQWRQAKLAEFRERFGDAQERFNELFARLKSNLEEAKELDPNNNMDDYAINQQNGQFTRSSRRAWRMATDDAIKALERAQQSVDEIIIIFDEMEKYNIPRPPIETNLKQAVERIDREIQRLRRDRNRRGI